MPQARCRLVSTEITPFYHVVSRCVRRHFLCGVDPLTGKDYSDRKRAIQERLADLAETFAIDVCAYAILSNHYHLVVHIDEQTAQGWSEHEVAKRWLRLFTGPPLVRAFVNGQELGETQRLAVDNHLREYRKRLCSLSWFMKCLNEPIAREANAEDGVTGHFWQSRFSSQALLDEAAVLTAMAYVDLNPIRAGIADAPEGSDFTSIQQRIEQWRASTTQQPQQIPKVSTESLEKAIVRLMPFSEAYESSKTPTIPHTTTDYLDLVDWSGRAISPGKRGAIPADLPPILERLHMRPEKYLDYVGKRQRAFPNVLGAVERIKRCAAHFGKTFLKGQTAAAALFSPGA